MDFLFDTSVVSLLLRRPASDPLRQKYASHVSDAAKFMSFQTLGELFELAERNNWGVERRTELDIVLSNFTVLNSDHDLARVWAVVRAVCQNAGRRLEPPDAWIFATASLYNLPLLTHDRDFTGLPIAGVTVICYA